MEYLVDRLNDSAVTLSTALNAFAVDTWCPSSSVASLSCLFSAIVVDVFEIESVDMARDVPENEESASVHKAEIVG